MPRLRLALEPFSNLNLLLRLCPRLSHDLNAASSEEVRKTCVRRICCQHINSAWELPRFWAHLITSIVSRCSRNYQWPPPPCYGYLPPNATRSPFAHRQLLIVFADFARPFSRKLTGLDRDTEGNYGGSFDWGKHKGEYFAPRRCFN